MFYGVPFYENLGLDDPVGATSVHLLGGITGTLLVGFFAKEGGLFYNGGVKLIISQLIGIGFTAVVVFPASLLVWWAMDKIFGIRVTEKEETEGLDVGEMGYEAYVMENK